MCRCKTILYLSTLCMPTFYYIVSDVTVSYRPNKLLIILKKKVKKNEALPCLVLKPRYYIYILLFHKSVCPRIDYTIHKHGCTHLKYTHTHIYIYLYILLFSGLYTYTSMTFFEHISVVFWSRASCFFDSRLDFCGLWGRYVFGRSRSPLTRFLPSSCADS